MLTVIFKNKFIDQHEQWVKKVSALKTLLKLLYAVIIISVAYVAYLRPYHNWDMLGYMACAVSIDVQNSDSVHSITYNHAKAELSHKDYEALVNPTNNYRKRNLEDSEYFHEQLSLYSIKPLYILLVYLFFKAGISLTAATVLPSVLAYAGIGWLLFFWMMKFISTFRAFIFSVLLMLSPPLWETAMSSTPDALAGLTTFAAFFFILEKKNFKTGLLFLLIAIAVRIDAFLLAIMVAIFLKVTGAGNKKITTTEFLVFSATSLLLFSAIAFWLGQFDTDTIGYYAFVHSDFASGLTTNPVLEYVVLLAKGMYSSQHSMITIFLLLAFATILLRRSLNSIQKDFESQIIMLLLLHMLLRYFLHPTIEDRFLLVHYLVIVIIFIKTIFGKFLSALVPANG
jgi:hypothetical protein